LFAGGAGLYRHEGPPKHLAGKSLDLGHRFSESYPPLAARLLLLELAFAPPAGVDLGFYDPNRASQLLCRGDGVDGAQDRDPARNRDAEFLEDGFGLVLVDIHLRSFVPAVAVGLNADQAVFTPVQRGNELELAGSEHSPHAYQARMNFYLVGSAARQQKYGTNRCYAQIDEMTHFGVAILFDYSREHPTTDDILKAVYRVETKQPELESKVSKDDPSGVGGLIAAFPSGFGRPASRKSRRIPLG
jgi:hypothetical protein